MPVGFEIRTELDYNVSEGVENAMRKRLKDAMDKGFAVSQEEVPEDRGTLRQTAFPPEWRDGELVWGYTQPYALPMEFGTGPFHPPTKPLVEWAKRVTGDPGLGYFLANVKIPEEGIDSHPYARPGAEAAKKWLKHKSLGSYVEDEFG